MSCLKWPVSTSGKEGRMNSFAYLLSVLLVRYSLVAIVSITGSLGLAFAQEVNLPSLIKTIQPSVVSIAVYDAAGTVVRQGSGFFVSEIGDVITNRHVLEGAIRAEIKTTDGASYSVTEVVAENQDADLVQVSVSISKSVPKPLPVTQILPEVGERVLVIGSPFGLEQTVSDGIVSAIRTSAEFGGRVIQITAPISPGSSGSPVINMKGQVIGVATFQIVKGQNLNFAIPVENLSKLKKGRTLAEWGLETDQSSAKRAIPPPQSIDADAVDAAARFYRGRRLRILVGFAMGGGFDTYSRVIGQHLGKYIPGIPGIVVENMPGAGSLVSANYVFNVAKPDGLTIGNFTGQLFIAQALGLRGFQFDARKFEHIGVPASSQVVCAFTTASGITSMDKWTASKTLVKLGGVAPGSALDSTAGILKEALGLPVQLVSGYRGTAAIKQAAENGDIDGTCWDWNSMSVTWRKALDSGDVVIVLQAARRAHPELPSVPLALNFAKTEEARQLIEVGIHGYNDLERAYVFPPGTPKERVRVIRKAFEDTMKDPEFLLEANRAKLVIDPVPWQQIERIIGRLSNLNPTLRSKLSEILSK